MRKKFDEFLNKRFLALIYAMGSATLFMGAYTKVGIAVFAVVLVYHEVRLRSAKATKFIDARPTITLIVIAGLCFLTGWLTEGYFFLTLFGPYLVISMVNRGIANERKLTDECFDLRQELIQANLRVSTLTIERDTLARQLAAYIGSSANK